MRPETRPEKLPFAQRLRQRRFIVIDLDTPNEMLVWIDDDGTCDIHHNIGDDGKTWNTKHHVYRHIYSEKNPDAKETVLVIRCPVSVEDDEWKRTHADEPRGEWFRIVKRLREDKQARGGKNKKGPGESFIAWILAAGTAAARLWQ